MANINASPKAFSLVEVLVSLVIVTIIGVASWSAINVLSPASQATRLRIKAEHLITLMQEELHQYAQNQANFDTNINNCGYSETHSSTSPIPCNFIDVFNQFPELTSRSLTFISADSTPNLKKFDVQVTWNELGKIQTKDSVILLARPPDPLPGNITGLFEDNNGNILKNVQVVIQSANTPSTIEYLSQSTESQDQNGPYNFTFAQQPSNYFVLGVGTWNLTATLPGYSTQSGQSSFTESVKVFSSQETNIGTIVLVSNPIPANLNVDLIDANGNPLTFNQNSTIELFEDGQPASNVSSPSNSNGGSNFTFAVSFSSGVTQRCFTIATYNAYKSNLAGNFNCDGFPYESDGSSTAQANVNDAHLNCPEPWVGIGSGTDDTGGVYSPPICVTPAENNPTPTNPPFNITLATVPTATVTAHVLDQTTNQPINATPSNPVGIEVWWPDGSTVYSNQTYTASTDGQGDYLVTVPAAQELFADVRPDFDEIQATVTMPQPQCCNQNATVQLQSNLQRVGPLYTGSNVQKNLNIPTNSGAPLCGDANGQVNDAKTGAILSNASVTLSGANTLTGGGGQYNFQCTSGTPPYDLPAGMPNIFVSDTSGTGYYPYPYNNYSGFNYYNTSGAENIIANQSNVLGPIGLWPIGQGTINGTVTEAGTNVGLGGIQVVLNIGAGGPSLTATTDSSGYYEFDNVQETWPPTALIGNPAYNQYALNDFLSVAGSTQFAAWPNTQDATQVTDSVVTLTAQGTTTVNIQLTSVGGL